MDTIIVSCSACGAKNRKSPLKGADNPVCGKCGKPLPRGGGPVALDAMSFDAVLKASPVPTIVDFWATWCGPCRAFAPVYEAYAGKHADEVLCAKVDTDQNRVLGQRFQITAIPTIVMFRGPIEIARMEGALPAPALEQWVGQALTR